MFGFLFCEDEPGVSFEYMYKKYKSTVRYMIEKVIFDEALADDVFQEIFSKFCFSMHKVHGETASRKWLMRIARNTIINMSKKDTTYKKHINLTYDIEYITDHTSENEPMNELLRAEMAEKLRSVLDDINPIYCEALELKYFMDYTVEEIAEFQQVALSTAYYRLVRGQTILYNALYNYVLGEGGNQ